MSRKRQVNVARAIAAEYAAQIRDVVNTAGGWVWLWNWRACGWCPALEDASRFRPGVLFVNLDSGELMATAGGNHAAGAERFEKVTAE